MRAAASHAGPHPALVAVIMASGLLALGTVGLATGRYGFVADRTLVGLTAIGYGGLGAWVWMRAVPEIGRRMTVVALAAALNWAAQGWSAMTIAGWASRWTWLLPALLIPLVLSRFPDGRPPVRRGHLIERALAASTVIATLALALAAIVHRTRCAAKPPSTRRAGRSPSAMCRSSPAARGHSPLQHC